MMRRLFFILSILPLMTGCNVYTFEKREIVKEKVTYNQIFSDVRIAGELYLPFNFVQTRKYPAIVVVHPAGGVKEQVGGLYAERLSRTGFVTLAYDAAYQGEAG
ncbi:MAG: alpha/beta hydrolase [Oxalobacter formigenes]|nr:alpha/beta hydrolase [Oxalobacter formigenes]